MVILRLEISGKLRGKNNAINSNIVVYSVNIILWCQHYFGTYVLDI